MLCRTPGPALLIRGRSLRVFKVRQIAVAIFRVSRFSAMFHDDLYRLPFVLVQPVVHAARGRRTDTSATPALACEQNRDDDDRHNPENRAEWAGLHDASSCDEGRSVRQTRTSYACPAESCISASRAIEVVHPGLMTVSRAVAIGPARAAHTMTLRRRTISFDRIQRKHSA
jgi:hypothetical protein